jgi:hypothetical protein
VLRGLKGNEGAALGVAARRDRGKGAEMSTRRNEGALCDAPGGRAMRGAGGHAAGRAKRV